MITQVKQMAKDVTEQYVTCHELAASLRDPHSLANFMIMTLYVKAQIFRNCQNVDPRYVLGIWRFSHSSFCE
jgi:hypothetical protein